MTEEDFRFRVVEFMGRVDERLKRLEGSRGWMMSIAGAVVASLITGVILLWLR